jgi:hypothetical protein
VIVYYLAVTHQVCGASFINGEKGRECPNCGVSLPGTRPLVKTVGGATRKRAAPQEPAKLRAVR